MSSDAEILAELQRIRELLTPKPEPPAPPEPKGFSAEFMAFFKTYKVLGLAVAFILGVYLGALVQALVKDLILPVIGIALSGLGNLSTYAVSFMNQNFACGDFLIAQITFLIVVLVIFIIVKLGKRYHIE